MMAKRDRATEVDALVGRNLADAMDGAAVTAEMLASALEVDTCIVEGWIAGTLRLKPPMMIKVLVYLQIGASRLFLGNGAVLLH